MIAQLKRCGLISIPNTLLMLDHGLLGYDLEDGGETFL
jgi:hypothetical protein